jgi:hypothetical protein
MVWVIQASLQHGLQHQAGLRVLNDDGKTVLSVDNLGAIEFVLNAQGRPMRNQAA